MSIQRTRFEEEVQKAQPNWEAAIDNLSALAMFEMLPALATLQDTVRGRVLEQARQILGLQRQWLGARDRIEFACDVVHDRRLTSWSRDLPEDQVEDARSFLITLLRPGKSRAKQTIFLNLDSAAIAAIEEINPTSIAINREFSGTVFQRGPSFGFTAPVRGGATDSEPNVPVPPGTTPRAIYHTHGNGVKQAGAEVFSPDDMFICGRLGRFSYLGTPSNRIKKLIPSSLMSASERKENPLGIRQVTIR